MEHGLIQSKDDVPSIIRSVTMVLWYKHHILTVIISEGRQSTPTTVTRTELERARVGPNCLETRDDIYSFNVVFFL